MDKTFDDFFEEGQSYCIKCNYPKAYECFVNALKINFDAIYFWNKINSIPRLIDYYLPFFNKYLNRILNDIEMQLDDINTQTIENIDLEYKLNNLMFILSRCLVFSSKRGEWAKCYKLLGNIYYIHNDYYNAYECFKSALYFKKNIGVKPKFDKLVKKYGKDDKTEYYPFNYCLIENIHFKTCYKSPCTPVRYVKRLDGVYVFVEEKSNRINFFSNGNVGNVEKLAISYYNKLGYKAYHDEGGIMQTLPNIIEDIYKYHYLKREDYNRYIDIINSIFSEINDRNYRDIFFEYYNLNKQEEDDFKFFDYIEYLGYDEWIQIIELIGVEKYLNYVKEKICRNRWCGWPYSGMPDLLVHDDKEVFFVEVKSTNDHLFDAQIWQHRWISKQLGIPIVIFLVNKNEEQINYIKKQYLI